MIDRWTDAEWADLARDLDEFEKSRIWQAIRWRLEHYRADAGRRLDQPQKPEDMETALWDGGVRHAYNRAMMILQDLRRMADRSRR